MFALGDLIECVDAAERPDCGEPAGLVAGALYTVTDFWPIGSISPVCAWARAAVDTLQIAERPNPFRWGDDFRLRGGWAADRFRHVYRPDPELIKLLQRAPTPELEPA